VIGPESEKENDEVEGGDDEKPPPVAYGPLDPVKREKWLADDEVMSDEELKSPRMYKIMAMGKGFTIGFPNEKMIFVSRFVRFLNILKTAIRRKGSVTTTEFTGYVNSSRRIDNMRVFGGNPEGLDVLFQVLRQTAPA
jgi:hypothetical protein